MSSAGCPGRSPDSKLISKKQVAKCANLIAEKRVTGSTRLDIVNEQRTLKKSTKDRE